MVVGERSDGARGGIAPSHVAPPTYSTLIILPSLPPRRHLRFLLGVVTVRAKENVVSYRSRKILPSLEGSLEDLPSSLSRALAHERKPPRDFPTATDVHTCNPRMANSQIRAEMREQPTRNSTLRRATAEERIYAPVIETRIPETAEINCQESL